jgi:hypothetical protein
MPSEDRERSFERALASHLRTDGAAGFSTGECSDSETLAAYHEGALAPDQIASLKTHLAACDRCQQILAQLQATDEIPLAVAPESIPTSAQLQVLAARKSVHAFPVRKLTAWRWVAPAGALAAVLLIWITVHGNRSLQFPSRDSHKDSTSAQLAKSMPPASSVPEYVGPVPSREVSPKKEAPAANTFNPANGAPAAPSPVPPTLQFHSLAKEKSSAAADRDLSAANNLAPFSYNSPDAATGSESAKKDARSVGAAESADSITPNANKSETSQLKARRKSANENTSVRESQSAVAGAAPAPESAPSARAQAAAAPAAVGGVTQTQDMSGMSRFGRQAEVRLANSIGDVTISAPGERVSWRIGQAGLIGFSADAGKSWTVQRSGVISDLLAGSAPSEQVCWIVGRSGAILRTTDGGAHWQKIRPPAQDDFRSVFAVNARQATMSSASASFQTTDGGLTWHKVPPE